MSTYFKRARKGGVTASFQAAEVEILRGLLMQLLELLDSEDRSGPGVAGDELDEILGIGAAVEPPEDPVLARLFPDAYTDVEAAAEFRRYTEQDLAAGKRDAARTALATLDDAGRSVPLDAEQARCWLGALNDLRLAIGTRLDITEDYEGYYAQLAFDDPRRPAFELYLWLGHLQETLVRALG